MFLLGCLNILISDLNIWKPEAECEPHLSNIMSLFRKYRHVMKRLDYQFDALSPAVHQSQVLERLSVEK